MPIADSKYFKCIRLLICWVYILAKFLYFGIMRKHRKPTSRYNQCIIGEQLFHWGDLPSKNVKQLIFLIIVYRTQQNGDCVDSRLVHDLIYLTCWAIYPSYAFICMLTRYVEYFEYRWLLVCGIKLPISIFQNIRIFKRNINFDVEHIMLSIDILLE